MRYEDCVIFLLLLSALAAEPTVVLGEDSWIEASVPIAAEPEAVFALVSDPVKVAEISGSTHVKAVPEANGCLGVETEVPHAIATVVYSTRACPDGDLAQKHVLTGGQMKEFDSRWWVTEAGGAAVLHYRIRTVTTLFVPQFVVNRSSVKSVEETLVKLRDHFEG